MEPSEITRLLSAQDIQRAYDTATLAAQSLFEASEKAIIGKDTLESSRLDALANGSIVGKNADEREASARTQLKYLFDELSNRQLQERAARYNFDQAMRNIEKIRALLRLMEILSGVVKS